MSDITRDPVSKFVAAHPGSKVAVVAHADADATVYHISYGDHRCAVALSDFITASSILEPADVVLRELERSWERMREEVSRVPA